jgi:N,N'-diacetyllegionaminate synthase
MSQSFTIENRRIGHDAPVFIIAEIGINHGGSEELAAQLVAAAARVGADAVKFQTVNAEESYLLGTESYGAFKGKGLSVDALRRLAFQSREAGLVPFSTPGDSSSLQLMLEAGLNAIKISSGQMTNVPLLQEAARTGLPLIISSGMADLTETRTALQIARSAGAVSVALLHCTSLYPASADTLNLRAIGTMRAAFDVPIGYSDHHLGPLACMAAVSAGACIVEKHFTLDSSCPGADHAISSEPAEFTEIVRTIRLAERMLGSPVKAPTTEEVMVREQRYRYLVARAAIPAGAVFSADCFFAKRVPSPTAGIPAAQISSVLGRRARRQIAADEIIIAAMIGDRS